MRPFLAQSGLKWGLPEGSPFHSPHNIRHRIWRATTRRINISLVDGNFEWRRINSGMRLISCALELGDTEPE